MNVTCPRKILLVLVILLLSHIAVADQSKELAIYFSQKSIPVFEINKAGQVITIKLRYEKLEDLSAEKLESDQLMVLRKIAAEYPQSRTLRLEYYGGDQVILSNVYKTSEALDFSNGAMNQEGLLGNGSLDITGGVEDLFSQEPLIGPDEGSVKLQTGRETGQTSSGQGFSSGKVSYLGAQYLGAWPEGIRIVNILADSPAQHAGLQVGDIILAIEDQKIGSSGLQAQQVADFVFSLPCDRPLRFLVERNYRTYDVYIQLTGMGKNRILKLMEDEQERFKSIIEDGKRCLERRDYDAAIQAFHQAQEMYPTMAFQGLGISYYNKRYFDDAFYYLARAYENNPQSALTLFYMSVTLDHWGKKDEAIFCFETYLRLQDKDRSRQDFARHQLDYLLDRYGRNKYFPFKSIDEIIDYILIEDR